MNRSGRRIAGFPVSALTRATHGRYISIPRADLADVIYREVRDRVEAIFNDSIREIEQTANAVRVSFERAPARTFDIVVGADGLHSRVRHLIFGADENYERFLDYKVAAFQVSGYRPRDELTYVMYPQVDQQLGRFALRDDRTLFLFTFADEIQEPPETSAVAGQKQFVRKRFENGGWECPQILDAMESSDDFYFDRVSQIHMDPAPGLWTKNRVTLIGDAASCVSLLGGEGSGLGMAAAYILAGELHRSGGHFDLAFARYQNQFGPFVAEKQGAARRFAGIFAPKSQLALFLHNEVMNLMSIGWVARLAGGSALSDSLVLPDY